ncbi:ArsR/SmtB family transcription factor [Kitasatospora acidiphila]|uniref:ArsR/SmtB family transcription factor n=1 Tax=Kitasatospora acidiphila TaxID=2567942 RepID=UPI0015F00255|nr:ArsR family transcriptional regulator [Kitasatospora acidiphila]
MPAELDFSADDLALLRFAVSPLWEVVASYRLLRSAAAHRVHRRWAEQVGARVTAAGLDGGWLAELFAHPGYAPDFLNPAPSGPAPTLAEELAVLTVTPADRVRRDLDHLARHQGPLGPRLRALHADPPARLDRLAAEIEAYWQLALAPYWARIRAVLDADLFHRARQVAERGAGQVLDDLHESLSWDGARLRLRGRKQSLARRRTGPGLVLVPVAFGGDRVRSRVAPPDPPQLAYPTRGSGTLWEPRPTADGAALAAVLGRSRTRLLIELDTPASTTELAHRTGLSAAAVSQYLTALRAAGLVSAHRAGRWVLYARTAAGETLLAASG